MSKHLLRNGPGCIFSRLRLEYLSIKALKSDGYAPSTNKKAHPSTQTTYLFLIKKITTFANTTIKVVYHS